MSKGQAAPGEIITPLALFTIAAATRIPFASSYLYHMDSGHFALALEHYDIGLHQPHPPGYFLYVMLGRLLHFLIKDANTVFVVISVFFGAATAAILYLLGRDIFGKKTGVVASVFAITSPNLWFHGEVALSYVVEAFFGSLTAWLCLKTIRGDDRFAAVSAAALAAAGGIRQNTIVFMLPLWLYSVGNVPLKKKAGASALLLCVCLIWFIPMVVATGGLQAYRSAFHELWLFNTGHMSVFERGLPSLKLFASCLFDFTMYGIGAAVFVLSAAAYAVIRNGRLPGLDREKLIFFSLWILPSFLFYLLIFIHPANPGYALSFLPPLLLLAAASVEYLGKELKARPKTVYSAAAMIAAANAACFLFLKFPVSLEEIRQHDKNTEKMINAISLFEPSKTAVLVGPYVFYGYRQIMYYLPAYRVWQVDARTAPDGSRRKIFRGSGRMTFLSDGVEIPEGIDTCILPLISEDKKLAADAQGAESITVSADISLVRAPISAAKLVYPELGIRIN